MFDRRDFLRTGAGVAVWVALSPRWGWGAALSTSDYEAQLKAAIDDLATKTMAVPGVARLRQHFADTAAAKAPDPQTFSEQFDNPVRLTAKPSANGSVYPATSFIYPTMLSNRSLAVAESPHLIFSNSSPTSATRLNVAEMNELGNKENHLLWSSCGCVVVQLPVSTKERREPTQQDHDRFGQWVEAGGVSTKVVPPGHRMDLQYVRELCLCGDPLNPLIGFGFESTPPQNWALAANRTPFTRHAGFGVTTIV